MIGPSDSQVLDAIDGMKAIIEGAANSNHVAELALMKAANADRLYAALRLVRPEIVHSIASGDGRFTQSQVHAIDAALAAASGSAVLKEAAE